ncbi:MAG: succinate dehydrogenase, cytochrome b556 subunit [Gammaproteobacteria bacterium]|jgi:succinate dehydrogenase / fumarate reductase cytochrome b subunit|nr:succinate dehydrogenase, cytochrome b556 subunit [Gammaproteobacteria bacterium]
MRQRPLSPHLDIYRFAYTMATSIAHRATGLILTAGFAVLIYWLVAAASSADSYASAQQIVGSGPVKLLLVGWLLAFCYHLLNGIRHLNWDRVRGLERHEARRSARIVIIATVVLFLVLGARAFASGVLS